MQLHYIDYKVAGKFRLEETFVYDYKVPVFKRNIGLFAGKNISEIDGYDFFFAICPCRFSFDFYSAFGGTLQSTGLRNRL